MPPESSLQKLEKKQPQPGADLQLTLDLNLQKTAETALSDRRGAVVVMDVKNWCCTRLSQQSHL